MIKELKLWGNGESTYTVSPDGKVTLHQSFPCSTPGPNYLKTVKRDRDFGSVGSDGYIKILNTDREYPPRTGYDGSYSDLYPYTNKTETGCTPK